MRLDAMGLNNVFANDVRTLPSPKLYEAMQLYLRLKGTGKAKTFQQAARRNVGVVVNVVNDMLTADYNTIDAGKGRRETISVGLTFLVFENSKIEGFNGHTKRPSV